MFDEDHLPAVFDLHDQSVGIAFNVEYGIWTHQIGTRVDFSYVH